MCIENGKRFYEKIRLQKIARDQCTGFSKERKDKKREYTRNRYHNLSEEDKQKPKEHEKNQIPAMSQEELKTMYGATNRTHKINPEANKKSTGLVHYKRNYF